MTKTLAALSLSLALLACGSDPDDDATGTTPPPPTAPTASAPPPPPTSAPATTVAPTVSPTAAPVDTAPATTAAPPTTSPPTTQAPAAEAACSGVSADAVDPTRLPLGDELAADAPTCDQAFTCQRFDPNAGGAMVQGPWFNEDGTWDVTKKLYVRGSVEWDHQMTVTVAGDDRVIASNDLPDHPTGEFPVAADDPVADYDRNPSSIGAQSLEYTLTANPTVAASATCIGGEVGVLLTGVMLFSPFDAMGRDAVAWESPDSCHGHPQNQGMYHYHSLTTCSDDPGSGHSSLLGYAFDGFGIFGTRGDDGSAVTNADLDECHGHTHAIDWDGAEVEMYHYHATAEFPYVVGCYRGTPIQLRPGG